MTRLDDEHAERRAQAWRAHASWAPALQRVAQWRLAPAARLDDLGQPPEWTPGQDWALGQLRAHLHAGDLRQVRIPLAAAPGPDHAANAVALRAELSGQANVFGNVDQGVHVRFYSGVQSCPQSMPVEIGALSAASTLAILNGANGIARWPAGRAHLVVFVAWPCGYRLRERFP
ncbi:hypothetical protein [Nocardia sp. NRRL S-836]|uniref:hypothetical protein n=1 Tax=Nocardia sp. NRRL S-836 TaxID=1519492 RepID=UPI0006AD9387|nr:hypothetical protein [Nocardia sp. NRRL S-836]KOV84656.1 hypothetical protein ADL03_15315 [Nocardia sp. NRRL S-836]